MRILGIDEAGRGCVLGSLFVGAFLIERHKEEDLQNIGVRDSKQLSPKKRLQIAEKIKTMGSVMVREITPVEIDTHNLNDLEERVIIDLVLYFQPDHVFIDALGHPSAIPKIVERLRKLAPKTSLWTMEPKADQIYPVVSAASILAKTTRDTALEKIKESFGDFGSGYPSDPKTKQWLASWNEPRWPDFVRTRWETVRSLRKNP